MRHAIILGTCATVLGACGAEPVGDEPAPPRWGFDEADEPVSTARIRPGVDGDLVTPTFTVLKPGSWVRDELGSCTERQDWLSVGARGDIDHILANRSTCSASSLVRHAGRWTTDRQVVRFRWANPDERVTREATFSLDEHELRLGAFVPADGGWHRSDVTLRVIDGHHSSLWVDVGLRVDGLELVEGSTCVMSATVAVDVDESSASEQFELPCSVHVEGDGFLVEADGMSNTAAWRAALDEHGVWSSYPARVAAALEAAFEPVLFTRDGSALWHRRDDSVYRFTEETPPMSMDDLGG